MNQNAIARPDLPQLLQRIQGRQIGKRHRGRCLKRHSRRNLRNQLGRSILLGLEFLVAADIIRTVAVTPTPQSVLVLAGIVAIRTFLSFSLELEITGRWPWQKTGQKNSATAAEESVS